MILELPISLKIANAKGKILSAVNLASVEYNLPAFILEGILSDIMNRRMRDDNYFYNSRCLAIK